MKRLQMIIVIAVVVLFNAMTVYSADSSMSFFVTSVGSGKGGDLGGLEGADAHSAQVGHHDRYGGGNLSWISAHATRGCSMEALAKTGGSGLFYCFAAD